ncbi:hypothetical protein SAMN04488540_11350 [Ferrimonas sediminum]|uniref:Uncharacterized protein n=2 Tax=Ferrimonas sediminum TaxID=718193 RepID=A0A1G8WFV6_9GAMM|nr:hypothetical protein SAMN04488540_11350 [Ferrimonas sediminum]
MILIALTAMFIIRYGLRPKYIAALIWLGIYGAYMSTLHTSFYLGWDVGQGQSLKILGAHTYTWALFVFVVVLVVVALLLAAVGNSFPANQVRDENLFGVPKLAFIVFFVVIGGNIVQAFTQTGPLPFVGQDAPGRVSFFPSYMSWEMDHWPRQSPDARGGYAIKDVDLNEFSIQKPVFSDAPLAKVEALIDLPTEINSRVTAIDYQQETDRYAVTTEDSWVYVLSGDLRRVLTKAHVDGMYQIHVSKLVGISFISDTTLVAMGDNKAYVVLELDENHTWASNYRPFRDSDNGIGELYRGVFLTVRAKYAYALSLGFDQGSNRLITITVPNEKSAPIVSSQFDVSDMTLSAENNMKTDSKYNQGFLSEYPYITGIDIGDDKGYVINSRGGEIISVNLRSGEATGKLRFITIKNFQGLVRKEDSFQTVNFNKGVNSVFEIREG